MNRQAGILLHPSSLPGPYGIGDIGPTARRFLHWLEAGGQSIWQILPLNPVDGFGCPYAAKSAFAAEPSLLSVDDLVEEGWLKASERPLFPGNPWEIDWTWVQRHKGAALALAADRVAADVDLVAWAGSRPWVGPWADLEGDDERAKSRAIALQWLFDQQWADLRSTAAACGVTIWGDLPMFVGPDSADARSRPDLFKLSADGTAPVVTGCPPDAFTPLGQRWGHAHFDLKAHRSEGHAWWLARVARLLEHVDAVRIDHFRGLHEVWEIPASDADATGGAWVEGLGAPLLDAIRDRFGRVPFIAEDLGVITPDVEALRDEYGLPGMAVLQFAFSTGRDADQPYLPHNHRHDQVVYPGTHDNDTSAGWYAGADAGTRDHVRRYLSVNGGDIAWDLIRAAYRSVARTAVVAMPDALSLGSEARMNTPGSVEGNWSWRCGSDAMNLPLARRLREEAALCGRVVARDQVPSPDASEAP